MKRGYLPPQLVKICYGVHWAMEKNAEKMSLTFISHIVDK